MSESPYQPTDRRPIAARRWPIWQRTAAWLARRRVSPNAISLAGMGAGVAAGLALAATKVADDWAVVFWIAAPAFVQLRLLANLLDGMVAIESNRASPVGELYNEAPDRISDAAILIGAGYSLGGDVVLGFVAACAALFTAYVRALGKSAGAPQEYCGPMAKQQRMALIIAAALFCGLTPASWQPTWHERGVVAAALAIVTLGCIVTSARRLTRIAANLQKGAP